MKPKIVLERVEQFRREVALSNERTRQNTVGAIKSGTEAVAAGAVARVPRASGELASTIRAEFARKGMLGFVKAGYGKLVRARAGTKTRETARYAAWWGKRARSSREAMKLLELGVYAPVIERGDPKRNRAPQPFLNPSLQQERPAIERNINNAVRGGIAAGGFAP